MLKTDKNLEGSYYLNNILKSKYILLLGTLQKIEWKELVKFYLFLYGSISICLYWETVDHIGADILLIDNSLNSCIQ